jgi:two-component system chemotaxis sensor kinase CheA
VLRLIFQPGFTTSEQVSQVSGRGVGLDVVARTVERLGGRVDVHATPGRGSLFQITLPLTLATARALLFEAGEALYALHTSAVERVVRVDQLHNVGGRLMVEYEGAAVPVAILAELFGGRADDGVAEPGAPRTVVIVGTGVQRVGLMIDQVVGEQEIVVKPLGYPLRRVRFVSGATILGSGRVVPILNVADVTRAASRAAMSAWVPQLPAAERRRLRVLVADDSLTTRTLERYILEAAGYEVELAGDGIEALSLLDEHACDVLVSDVNMPGLDGVALTAQLRQVPRFRELPIILVTSLASDDDRERGLQAGADAYMVKSSFDQDQLLRTIQELV